MFVKELTHLNRSQNPQNWAGYDDCDLPFQLLFLWRTTCVQLVSSHTHWFANPSQIYVQCKFWYIYCSAIICINSPLFIVILWLCIWPGIFAISWSKLSTLLSVTWFRVDSSMLLISGNYLIGVCHIILLFDPLNPESVFCLIVCGL